MKTNKQRNRELGKIHIGAKQIGLRDDDGDEANQKLSSYRSMLWVVARVTSASKLDDYGRRKVIQHLIKCGARFNKPGNKKQHHPGAPHNIDSDDRGPKLRKIEAMLAEAGRPWAYADSMAKGMYRKDKIALCGHDELTAIITAMMQDAKRHDRRTQ